MPLEIEISLVSVKCLLQRITSQFSDLHLYLPFIKKHQLKIIFYLHIYNLNNKFKCIYIH